MVTQTRLKHLLNYNQETGVFTKRVNQGSRSKAGDIAGSKHGEYLRITIDGKRYLAHRLAWLYVYGYMPENLIDHKDRVGSHNGIDNLREVSNQCNIRNSRLRKDSKSGITGVSWYKANDKWEATIRVDKQLVYLGRFDSLRDAAKARFEAEVKYNFLSCDEDSSAYRFLELK